MSMIESMGAGVAEPRAGLRLVPTDCPVCAADEAEPVAVGQDFVWSAAPDAFLALRCRGCGVVYLSPRPAPEERERLYPPECFGPPSPGERARRRAFARHALRLCPPLPAGARVLEVAYGAHLHTDELRDAGARGWTIDAVTPHRALTDGSASGSSDAGSVTRGWVSDLATRGAPYDAALFLHSLEHCDRPVEELSAIAGLLQPGAPVIVVTPNSDALVARMFAGRHWPGYDFPRRPCLYSPGSLKALAAAAGFEAVHLRTFPSSQMWSRSVQTLVRDWRMSGPMARLVNAALGNRAVAFVAEGWGQTKGAGALLGAVLRKRAGGRG